MWGKHLRYLVSTCSLELRLAKSDSEEVKRRRAVIPLANHNKENKNHNKIIIKCQKTVE